MGKWEMVPFTDIFVDVTSKATKIPKENYLAQGNYQIIDQGKSDIAGYTNEHSGIFAETPAIVFGDHTRILKYVDQPLFIGADGVKLLKSKLSDINYRYLYYALCSVQIENTGYNRHFKWLKKSQIPLPPLDEQKRIAKNLDLVSEIVKGYKGQLAELDNLVQSVFYEMFGDPVTNEKGWEEREIGDIYEINPKKSELHISKDIEVSFIPMQAVSALGEIDLSLTKRFSEVEKGFTYFKENDVLFAKITPCMENGKGAVAKGLKNGIGVGSTEFHVLRGKNGYSEAIWLYYFTKLDVFREKAKSNMTGSAGQKRVPATYLAKYKLPLPPLPLQTCFASIFTEIEAQKAQIQQALTEAENLFNSLMQEYFE